MIVYPAITREFPLIAWLPYAQLLTLLMIALL